MEGANGNWKIAFWLKTSGKSNNIKTQLRKKRVAEFGMNVRKGRIRVAHSVNTNNKINTPKSS